MRIASWNINGIKSTIKVAKDGFPLGENDDNTLNTLILEKKLDVLCLQEIRTSSDEYFLKLQMKEFFPFFSERKKGYSGVAILTNLPVVNVYRNFDMFEENFQNFLEKLTELQYLQEGRLLTLELEKFVIVNVYTPNSQSGLVRLPQRLEWDFLFGEYVAAINKYCVKNKKTAIFCGDFNVALEDIDIFNPSTHHHSAGFSDEERTSLTSIISDNGIIDVFRSFHPTLRKYTFFSNFKNSRENNNGWRLDYFFLQEDKISDVNKISILSDYFGSDHIPIFLELGM